MGEIVRLVKPNVELRDESLIFTGNGKIQGKIWFLGS